MTPAELSAALDRLNLTVTAFADQAGVSRSTAHRWLAGETAISGYAVRILELLSERAQLARLVGTPTPPAKRMGRPRRTRA